MIRVIVRETLDGITTALVTFLAMMSVGFGKSVAIAAFPRARNRFKRLVLSQLTPTRPFIVPKLWPIHVRLSLRNRRPARLIVSSDFVNPETSSSVSWLHDVNCEYFIWNDELEALSMIATLKKSPLRVASFFRVLGLTMREQLIVRPIDFVPVLGSVPKHTQPRIFFAGGISPEHHQDIISTDERAEGVARRWRLRLANELPNFLFEYDAFQNSALSPAVYAALRHREINLWRQRLISRLIAEFGADVWLLGNGFSVDTYNGATRLASTERIFRLYRESRINLDLGSQCGQEYLYPRSLEILSQHPGSLVTYSRTVGIAPPGARVWESEDELVALCREMLSGSSSA